MFLLARVLGQISGWRERHHVRGSAATIARNPFCYKFGSSKGTVHMHLPRKLPQTISKCCMRATNKVIGLAGARQVVHQQPCAGWKRLAAAVTHGKTAACPGIAQGNNAHRGRAGKGPATSRGTTLMARLARAQVAAAVSAPAAVASSFHCILYREPHDFCTFVTCCPCFIVHPWHHIAPLAPGGAARGGVHPHGHGPHLRNGAGRPGGRGHQG